MNLLSEDEKKDNAFEEQGCRDRRQRQEEGEDFSDNESDGGEEVVDLPPELAKLIGTKYQTQEQLQIDLIEAGIGDLPIILVSGKPSLVMPTDQHNSFTSDYVHDFSARWSRWGFCTGTHNIHLTNGKTRQPDLSYWGYNRCEKNKRGNLNPINFALGSIPDVVIQFSWKNKKKYEEEAIDDMMIRGLEFDGGNRSQSHPRVGYLIKVQFSKKRTLNGAIKGTKTQDLVGIDIYRLPYNTTTQDAVNKTNGASKWSYQPGDEDSEIVITPEDLGITGFWATICGSYKVSVASIYEEMNKHQSERQRNLLAI